MAGLVDDAAATGADFEELRVARGKEDRVGVDYKRHAGLEVEWAGEERVVRVGFEHDGKPSLPTSNYAEYGSTGRGARPYLRRQLTPDEAARFSIKAFLAGDDQWDPTKVH